MVGISNILAVVVALLISVLLPLTVIAVILIKWREKKVVVPLLLGAAGFAVPQLLIRIPIISAISSDNGFQKFVSENYILYSLILAFTAALFELAGRYSVAKILSKNSSYERGFSAGMGHGAFEALCLIGISYIANLAIMIMINTGTFDSFAQTIAAAGQDAAVITNIQEQLVNTNPIMFILGGYERIPAIIFHIGLSLIVWYYVSKKQDIKGILICLALHTALDFFMVVIQGLSTDYLGNLISENSIYIIIYATLTATAVAMLAVIFKIRKKWKTA